MIERTWTVWTTQMSIFILSESAGILFEGAFSLWVSLKLILLQPLETIPIWVCHVLWKQFCCSCMYIKTARNKSQFLFLSGFSFMDTDDSQESRGREGTIFYSTLPLPLAHGHSDIYLHLCMWDDHHVFLIASLVFTRLLLSEIYHRVELPFDWLMMWC